MNVALTDAELDDLRAQLYQGLCNAADKARAAREAIRVLRHGTIEYDRLNNESYLHHGEVEGFSRALALFDQARRSTYVRRSR